MKAIVGLGNPGEEYADTRHNAGFLALDVLGEELGANYWKTECGALVAHCKNPYQDNDEIILCKPQSFMNLSGGPVKNLCEKYKISIEDVIVIHDDMDIISGSIRVKRGGSSAGHNGLKSITAKLQTDNYLRIRIGVDRAPGAMPYANYVLESPKGRKLEEFKEACNIASQASIFLLNHTLEQAQQEFNHKN